MTADRIAPDAVVLADRRGVDGTQPSPESSPGRSLLHGPGISLELREFRYFVAVAQELHFTRAAARLHIAQPPLSAAIRQLERRVGCPLFDRTSRDVRLTPAGEALLPKAINVIRAANDAAEVASAAARGYAGRLRVGVSRSAFSIGSALLQELMSRAPGIDLALTSGFSQPLLEDLLDGRVDAAVLFCPDPRPDLGRLRLADEPAVVVVRSSSPLGGLRQVSFTQLRDKTLVLAPPEVGLSYNAAIVGLCRSQGFVPHSVSPSIYLGPRDIDPGRTFGITTHRALEGVPLPPDVVRIPLCGTTLPTELVWAAGRDQAPVLTTLRAAAVRLAAAADWPPSRQT